MPYFQDHTFAERCLHLVAHPDPWIHGGSLLFSPTPRALAGVEPIRRFYGLSVLDALFFTSVGFMLDRTERRWLLRMWVERLLIRTCSPQYRHWVLPGDGYVRCIAFQHGLLSALASRQGHGAPGAIDARRSPGDTALMRSLQRAARALPVVIGLVAGTAMLAGTGRWPTPEGAAQSIGSGGALDGVRHRVLVSTDIGGTDPDDFQSMVHLLLYSDVLDLEGLVSSPHGAGRRPHILDVIGHYERDYPNLRRVSAAYPTADALRAITKQGETEVAPFAGVRHRTEGSDWIVERARRDDPRPLHVLVWGGIEDLAQALHDAPDILPKLRVYFIGGPNKKWSPDAYHYIATHHPTLWIIEANATYRGWFTGGRQDDEWENRAFVQAHVARHGSLGAYFADHLQGTIKMGDTPSVAWLLRGTPDVPSRPGWGGRFVRAWERPYVVFDRPTTRADQVEHFGILELVLAVGPGAPADPDARLLIENQSLVGHIDNGEVRFRFSPKDPQVYRYEIRSNIPALNGVTGEFTSIQPPASRALAPSPRLPNWWTDDPSPDMSEGVHHGARSVSQWRVDFLRDFAARTDRAQ